MPIAALLDATLTDDAIAQALLSERKLSVPEGVRRAILACDDLETLDGWLRRAVTAPSAADVLRP